MPVLCFVIHGIGPQNQDYSNPLQQGVHRELVKWMGEKAVGMVDYEPLYWANIGSAEQNNLYRKVYPDLFGTTQIWKRSYQLVAQLAPVRSLSMTLIGDIFGYLGRFQEAIKRQVFEQIVEKLRTRIESGKQFSLILVGHSLGTVILHDLISGFLRYRYAGFENVTQNVSIFTMGSPLSLFSLVAESADPGKFRKWVNFLHPRDPIAFPMASIFVRVKDISLRRFSWNPLSLHGVYWHHSEVHRLIAAEIVDHCKNGLAIATDKLDLGKVPSEIFQPFHGAAARAGFSSYFGDFHGIPFPKLIPKAREIDICVVYGGHWFQHHAQYFVEALSNPDSLVRICTLSPESPSLPGFSHHFSGTPESEIKKKIEDATNEFRNAFEEARRRHGCTGRLQIYRVLNIVNHGLYRFDDMCYWVPRPITSNKLAGLPLPTLAVRNTSASDDLFSWFTRDFELLIATQRDAALYFDSNPSPSSGEAPMP